jgi:hypothetical protein
VAVCGGPGEGGDYLITRLKLTEEALRAGEPRFPTFAGHAAAFFPHHECTARILDVNRIPDDKQASIFRAFE